MIIATAIAVLPGKRIKTRVVALEVLGCGSGSGADGNCAAVRCRYARKSSALPRMLAGRLTVLLTAKC